MIVIINAERNTETGGLPVTETSGTSGDANSREESLETTLTKGTSTAVIPTTAVEAITTAESLRGLTLNSRKNYKNKANSTAGDTGKSGDANSKDA